MDDEIDTIFNTPLKNVKEQIQKFLGIKEVEVIYRYKIVKKYPL